MTNTNRYRFLAVFAAVFFFCAAVNSSCYIIEHFEHECCHACTEDDCPVCQQLRLAELFVGSLFSFVLAVVCASVPVDFVNEIKGFHKCAFLHQTLVRLKVELLD